MYFGFATRDVEKYLEGGPSVSLAPERRVDAISDLHCPARIGATVESGQPHRRRGAGIDCDAGDPRAVEGILCYLLATVAPQALAFFAEEIRGQEVGCEFHCKISVVFTKCVEGE
ncbi:hypothetical protein A2J01_09305 [Rhodococcus sp. EPR-134]|nr:hypothetical protein A2J01_09305 [Rhodococcus sp. EPR-134]